jgi:ribonuclease P protein component
MTTMTNALSKKNRIRKRRDFLRVQRFGIRVSAKFFTLVGRIAPQNSEGRLGLTVSKAIGKAHVRNLIKRRLRHILRENCFFFIHFDLVVVAQPSIISISFEELRAELLRALTLLNGKISSKIKSKRLEKKHDLSL